MGSRKRMNVAEWSVFVWRRWLAMSLFMTFCATMGATLGHALAWQSAAIVWGVFTVFMIGTHEYGLRATLAASRCRKLARAAKRRSRGKYPPSDVSGDR